MIAEIDERGRCSIPGAPSGLYDAVINPDGTIDLVPLVRVTDMKPPTTPSAPKPAKARRQTLRRDWSKIPSGTVLTGPPQVGQVTMGTGGRLSTGRTPNSVFTDLGITRNAWDYLRLDDGRSVGEAYDAGQWD
jgi:hypothetical protein